MYQTENHATLPVLPDHHWEQLRQGDQTALSALYQQYAKMLYNYGRHITSDAALVQDCIHDLFLELWNHHRQLSPTTAVKPYLYKALRRKIVAEDKKITRQLTQLQPTETQWEESFRDMTASEPLDQPQHLRLTQAVSHLPKRQQEVVNLVFFENLTREEAAEVMEVDTRTVYSLTWRALKTLRKDLVTVYATWLLACLLFLS